VAGCLAVSSIPIPEIFDTSKVMTSLAAWVGVDSRGPTSIYIASDSRISWDKDARIRWDHAKKVFTSSSTPEIFGFCGDVLFPSIFLSQFTVILAGKSLGLITDPDARARMIMEYAIRSRQDFPVEAGIDASFQILYCCRTGENMQATFHAFIIEYSKQSGQWSCGRMDLPDDSGVLFAGGSGKHSVEKWKGYWDKSSQGGTSRAVFSAFCDSLDSGLDLQTGGAPQLVGIRRSFLAAHYGIIWKGSRYELGIKLSACPNTGSLTEWRNSLFERCDGSTMQPIVSAKRHHKPKGLGNELGIEGAMKVPRS